ncbi:hypothetical protein ACLMAL_24625 [Nocardia sp. CWNU-33]|uniref:hypothetical protein n=1 Tax=Nocardia sp. CWNU-33 TaxID=3392117 RepID=UPI00398F0BF3
MSRVTVMSDRVVWATVPNYGAICGPVGGSLVSSLEWGSAVYADPAAENHAIAVAARMLGGMPTQVCEAREAAWGMAVFGIAYPAIMGSTIGVDAARAASIQFVFGWILGLVACGFAGRWQWTGVTAIVLAFLQCAVCVWARSDVIPPVLWIVAVLYSAGVCAAVAWLLRRPVAQAWFVVGVSLPAR